MNLDRFVSLAALALAIGLWVNVKYFPSQDLTLRSLTLRGSNGMLLATLGPEDGGRVALQLLNSSGNPTIKLSSSSNGELSEIAIFGSKEKVLTLSSRRSGLSQITLGDDAVPFRLRLGAEFPEFWGKRIEAVSWGFEIRRGFSRFPAYYVEADNGRQDEKQFTNMKLYDGVSSLLLKPRSR